MSATMPYRHEKGPWWSVAESFVNDSVEGQARRIAALRNLEAGRPITEMFGVLDTPTMDKGPHTYDERMSHAMRDFFGGVYEEDGSFTPDEKPDTGMWINYHGNVEGIMREGLIRCLRISLGLTGDDVLWDDADVTRCIPIRFQWTCPSAWFETWIEWAPEGVTFKINTPAEGHPILATPAGGRKTIIDPPLYDASEQGMVLVSHSTHLVDARDTTGPVKYGEMHLPWISYMGVGPVVTVEPHEIDGGVAAQGREYIAP